MAMKNKKLDFNHIEFFKPLEAGYKCNICKLVLISPFQTVCGHRFCEACIKDVITSGSNMCPVDNTVLSMEQIYKDRNCNRWMMEQECFCSSKDRGCNWRGPLKSLEGHQSQCES